MITPTTQQADAIRKIVKWYKSTSRKEFFLAGFAGVGKSSLVEIAIEEIRATRTKTLNVLVLAFTGKAANVLRKKGIDNASTIHSAVYTPYECPETGDVKFRLAVDGPACLADLIVIDEVSMVSEEMANDLRSFGKKILVTGDPGQIPPVNGEGAFTNREPDVFLTEIHRQAAESPIIRLATLARQGLPIPVGTYGDCKVIPLRTSTQAEVLKPDTQVICGLNKVRHTITKMIRGHLGYDGVMPLKGERIMCCRNDREMGLFNGALGRMVADAREQFPMSERWILDIQLDDEIRPLKHLDTHPYLFRQHFSEDRTRPRMRKGIQEFDWGYVLTAHKSQGSQFPHVTVVDDSGSFREDSAKWLYTSLSRAIDGLTLMKRVA